MNDLDPRNITKLRNLLSAYKKKGKKINLYRIQGNYIDVSPFFDKFEDNS